MRILFVSPRQCWPPLNGAKLREFFLARALGRRGALTHVFFRHPGVTPPDPEDLPLWRRLVPVPRPRPYTPSKIIRGFLGRWPLPVVNYTSREMQVALTDVLKREPFDIVHIDSIHMAAYVSTIQAVTDAPIVYDWHNIESEAMHRYSAKVRSPLHKIYAAFTAERLAAVEKQALGNAFGHVVCSERERGLLQRIAPRARVAVVENGVDTRFFADAREPLSARRCIIFVGSLDYHANVEAAVSFSRTVWPLIRERFPEWRFTLVGSNPAPAVVALSREKNIEVTGTVADVRPFYRQALAAIVPLRIGGGTRLKILEAMAAGVPVVSTTLGAEGLMLCPGVNVLIADKPEDWLSHLEALSGESNLWCSLVEAGLALVQSRYDWEVLGDLLYATYRDWLNSANT
jgi:sugar transferase (PEP-CTERM/EpsH1 system associated)